MNTNPILTLDKNSIIFSDLFQPVADQGSGTSLALALANYKWHCKIIATVVIDNMDESHTEQFKDRAMSIDMRLASVDAEPWTKFSATALDQINAVALKEGAKLLPDDAPKDVPALVRLVGCKILYWCGRHPTSTKTKAMKRLDAKLLTSMRIPFN